MIFSFEGHIEMIKSGEKTQTRRQSDYYRVGRTYSIQPGRQSAGIPEGRIRIIRKRKEYPPGNISKEDAWDEGMYMTLEFERLYNEMYPGWLSRYAYDLEFVELKAFKQGSLIE